MAGMLQIITYLLGVYLVMKGIEILQIGLASTRPDRRGLIFIGIVALIVCVAAAGFFVNAQDEQARSLSRGLNP
jgi:uncharacterized membrane protein HdeD (DUF308 family)